MTFDAGINGNIPDGELDERAAGSGINKIADRDLPAVLCCLFQEHRHLAALMRALERRVRQAGSLEAGDYYLLRDIVGYLHDYPDSVHHPTENLLFEKLLKREPSAKKSVAGLRRDHKAVAVETMGLLELLDKAIERPGKQLEQAVRRDCLAFIEHQRKHMQFENQKLFPAAIESLSDEDWRQIEVHFALVEDPLFGRVVENSHRLLYEYLVNPAAMATEGFSVSRLFSLEHMILTAEMLEKTSTSSCARLKELGLLVSGETRSAISRSLKPENLGSALFLPIDYATFVARSLLDCSADLAKISTSTVKDTLAIFTGRNAAE